MATKGDEVDIETWLKEKNLEKLIPDFKQRKITIEELCDFEESDLKEFGVGFGLDKFDAARFAKFIVKQKQELRADNTDNAMSRAVVITVEEEKYLQKLDDRKSEISSLIARADSDSSTQKTLNAKNEEIIEAKFNELIKQIEERKKIILSSISQAQQDKQAIIDKNVITLKEYLVNIENINNEYNRWLIQNKMNRYERKDKLAKIVEEECDKLLPQVADVQIVYNSRLVQPFLNEICKITNIGLFYPEISCLEVTNIGPKCVTIKWRAKLRKEHLIYVEESNLSMNHVMMSLDINKSKKEETKDEEEDDDEEVDEDEIEEETTESKEDENVSEIDKDMIHCIDYELDEEEYEYRFDGLRQKTKYNITLKCISIVKDLLISEHHQQDLNKFKPLNIEFKTLKQYKPFLFISTLNRIDISNDGQTVNYVNATDGRLACVQLGDIIDTEVYIRKFKLTLSIDQKADHIGFGFIAEGFQDWEHDDWGFGGHCTFYYSDRDFRGSAEFHNNNPNRLTLHQGNIIHVAVDCEQLIGKVWLDGHEAQGCETTLPPKFALAVSIGGRIGSSVSLTSHQEPYAFD